MVTRRPDAGEHAAVSAAVHAAEAGTSGEIVTIVAEQSDAYHDVALHFALLAMLFVPVLFAAFPAIPLTIIAGWKGGWEQAELREVLLLTFAAMILVFLLKRLALAHMPLRLALTPRATRARRVRRRAVELFRVGTEARTTGRTGILIYLSLGEHMAEIVADSAIHDVVAEDEWGEAMAALVAHVAKGDIARGMIGAIGKVGDILHRHLPRAADDANELPDRLIEL